MNRARIAEGLLLAAIAIGVHAADAPIVRTRISPATVVVGQPVTLSVDILVPTWFGGGIDYPPTIAIPGTVTKLSDERPANLNERIGGASHAGMSKSWVIVPQRSGAFEVPPLAIRVPYAVDGKTVVKEVQTAPQRFEAKLPAGADGLGYFIATRSYRLAQQVEPAQRSLKVGDAVTRKITQKAAELAPMFLPALHFEPIEGLEVYPAGPVLAESGGERGAPREASRIDAATYVVAKPGKYRLPALRIAWFDPGRAQMRWAEVPELLLDVAAPPVSATATPAADPSKSEAGRAPRAAFAWREVAAAVIGLALVLALAWRLGPFAWRVVCDWRARRAASEAAAFRQLRGVLRAGDATRARHAAGLWLARVDPLDDARTLSEFAARFGDAELQRQANALARDGFGATLPDHGADWNAHELERGLAAARVRWKRGERAPASRPSGPAESRPLAAGIPRRDPQWTAATSKWSGT